MKTPRESAINYEIKQAVEEWICGNMDRASYLVRVADRHSKMSDQDFDRKYAGE